MRIYATNELAWKGDRLVVQGGGRHTPSVELVPDSKWPGMWRVKRPDGTLTDMANHTWARDAAKPILLSILNSQETAPGASPMRFAGEAGCAFLSAATASSMRFALACRCGMV
jgi:hypothetical protein